MSILNPAGSGKVTGALLFVSQVYATGGASKAESLQICRITGHSGGTLVSPSGVNRFNTLHPNPACTVRVDNPAVITAGLPLWGVAPAISQGTGVGALAPFVTQPPGGTSFLCQPGEGLAFRTDDGDADVFWNMTYVWVELG